MADAKEMALQIVRENYRGQVGRVYEKDGEILVEAPAGTQLPADVKGFPVRLVDKPLPGRAPAAGATPASSSTSSSAKSRLEAARAENERLRLERESKLSPDEQHELDELEAENAKLRNA